MRPVLTLVTSDAVSFEQLVRVVGIAAGALGAGLVVQLREKTASREALVASARALRSVLGAAKLVVNGADLEASLAVARASDAHGVHVNAAEVARGGVARARIALGARAFVSAATHDDDDVRRAAEEGASAVLVSPIFATPGKGPPRGVGALTSARAVVDATSSPPLVFALGGVDAANAAACAAAGADGVAVIRAVVAAAPEAVAGIVAALAGPFVR